MVGAAWSPVAASQIMLSVLVMLTAIVIGSLLGIAGCCRGSAYHLSAASVALAALSTISPRVHLCINSFGLGVVSWGCVHVGPSWAELEHGESTWQRIVFDVDIFSCVPCTGS